MRIQPIGPQIPFLMGPKNKEDIGPKNPINNADVEPKNPTNSADLGSKKVAQKVNCQPIKPQIVFKGHLMDTPIPTTNDKKEGEHKLHFIA